MKDNNKMREQLLIALRACDYDVDAAAEKLGAPVAKVQEFIDSDDELQKIITEGEDPAPADEPEAEPAPRPEPASKPASKLPPGFLRASEAPQSDKFKGLIFGPTGTGKTTLLVTAPNPCIGITELKSTRRIRAVAKTLKKDPPVFPIRSSGDMDDFINYMRSAPETFTLCIDSVTDLYSIIENELIEERGGKALSLQQWGSIQRRVESWLRDLSKLDHHLLVIAGQKEYETKIDGEVVRKVVPAFAGDKLPHSIGGLFQVVGLAFKRKNQETGQTGWFIAFDGDEHITCKGDDGLRAVEVPNVEGWIANIQKAYEAGDHSLVTEYPEEVFTPAPPRASEVAQTPAKKNKKDK